MANNAIGFEDLKLSFYGSLQGIVFQVMQDLVGIDSVEFQRSIQGFGIQFKKFPIWVACPQMFQEIKGIIRTCHPIEAIKKLPVGSGSGPDFKYG